MVSVCGDDVRFRAQIGKQKEPSINRLYSFAIQFLLCRLQFSDTKSERVWRLNLNEKNC